jgi:hypothetical protein
MGPALPGRKLVKYSLVIGHESPCLQQVRFPECARQSLVNSVRFDKAGRGDQRVTSSRRFFEFGFHLDLTAPGRDFDRRFASWPPPPLVFRKVP